MIVVSDSSPLINLAAVGHLDLLRDLYGTIVIPPAVYQEVAMQDPGLPGVLEIRASGWIVCKSIADPGLVTALQNELDRGESEAIALALELPADLLLMDERRGRSRAARFGLRFIGILGVLVEAKARAYLPAIKPVLEELRTNAGFRISEVLFKLVLQEAGE